jgi:predicted exporter
MKTPRSHRLAFALWCAILLGSVLVILQTRFVSDLSAFMPKTPSIRQQMLVEQLRDGAIARLLIIGIEGDTPTSRARLSRQLQTRLAADGQFSAAQNGDVTAQQRDQTYFFDNRYLLSPSVDAARFSATGMHAAMLDTLDALSGDAGLLLKQLLPRDPTGETWQIINQFIGESTPRTDNGVWVSRDGSRALLLVQLRQSGLDTDAQARALTSIRQTFDRLPQRPADTRLVMSGTSVLSVASRDTIEHDAARLAVAGAVLVVGLLLLIYRSLSLLLIGLLPVVSGALVGIAAVSLGFGQVHGLTLGFGTTLIGEAVDYSIYLFIQRTGADRQGPFWRTIRLGVLTSVAGFATLLCSSFPGLSQLGLYSLSGLVTAALVTRYILPPLIPAGAALRDLSRAEQAWQTLIGALARVRWLIVVVSALIVIPLIFGHATLLNRKINALSPVPPAQSALDAQLRSDLGGGDMRYVACLTAPDQERALQAAERISPIFEQLMRQQVIGGFHSPSQLLPSQRMQTARQAALPDAQNAARALDIALRGLPLRAGTLTGYLRDLQTARQQPLLTRASLQGTSTGILLDSMLIKRNHDYLVMLPITPTGFGPHGDTIDLGKVRAALSAAHANEVTVIDLLDETTQIFDDYTHEMLLLSSLGSLAIVLLLGVACGPRKAFRVILPLACAVACVIGLLHLAGIQLTILHLVGLLLVVAIGSNYALFFINEEQVADPAAQRKVGISLLVANLATVCSFGLLGTSSVPVLSYIGSTVAIGALLSLFFAAALSRRRPHARSA